MNITNVFQAITATVMIGSASVTASANGTGIDLKDYEGEIGVILNASNATAGSSPTLDVKLQDSADNSSFNDISGAAFTQVTGSGGGVQKMTLNSDSIRRYIRHVVTIGGTSSPAFPVGLTLLGIKKYPA